MAFLEDYLSEPDRWRLRTAPQVAAPGTSPTGCGLNAELGARKLARESRDGSAAMGRRFLRLAASISGEELLSPGIGIGNLKFIWRSVLVWLRASLESTLQPPPLLTSNNR